MLMFYPLPIICGAALMINLMLWAGADHLKAELHTERQTEFQKQSLEAGKPIERELAGGQSHSYQIAMIPGQYLQISVAQKGIDVVLALFAPAGEKRGEVDRESGFAGVETISIIAETAGNYRIEVRPLKKEAKAGRYEIKIDKLQEATAEDRDRVAAGALFEEAERLFEGSTDEKRKSIDKYQEALA